MHLLAAGGFAAMLMTGCSKPQPVTFVGYRNFQLSHPSLQSTGIRAELVFFNPNPYPLQMKEAQMDVYLNEELLGHFAQDSLLKMPARDTFYYPVNLQVNLAGLLLKFLGSNLQDSMTLHATGNCKVGRNGDRK